MTWTDISTVADVGLSLSNRTLSPEEALFDKRLGLAGPPAPPRRPVIDTGAGRAALALRDEGGEAEELRTRGCRAHAEARHAFDDHFAICCTEKGGGRWGEVLDR